MALFQRYPKYIGSSVDPNKLSLTVKGILAALIPLVLMLAPMFHWTVTPEDFSDLTSAIESLIVIVTSGISAAMIVWGAIRKIAVGMGWWKVE